ncbi:MAG: hypothetical protein LQ347_001660 [Umbilicaria vellea]|nr:MAG: hypothetical protein LQ347_001660 [Umbilicaria vellea]
MVIPRKLRFGLKRALFQTKNPIKHLSPHPNASSPSIVVKRRQQRGHDRQIRVVEDLDHHLQDCLVHGVLSPEALELAVLHAVTSEYAQFPYPPAELGVPVNMGAYGQYDIPPRSVSGNVPSGLISSGSTSPVLYDSRTLSAAETMRTYQLTPDCFADWLVKSPLTIETSIIRLHMRLLDLSVRDHKRIPLAPVAAENRRAIEVEVQCGREFDGGVAEEADLQMGGSVERRAGYKSM